ARIAAALDIEEAVGLAMRAKRATPTLIASIACWLACVAAHAIEPVPLTPPPNSALPTGPLGDAIRYGQSLTTNTRALASGYVGNGLVCSNCHLDAGRVAYAAPLAGLWASFRNIAGVAA